MLFHQLTIQLFFVFFFQILNINLLSRVISLRIYLLSITPKYCIEEPYQAFYLLSKKTWI